MRYNKYNVPLYNCYWCICAWCINAYRCEVRDCYICHQRDKKHKLPMIRKECYNFIPRNDFTQKLMDEVQHCENCKYKKLYFKMKAELED